MADGDGAAEAAVGMQRVASQQDQTLEANTINSPPDPNLPKRPRDAHTIHTVLHHCGVTAYQERVPLQLMDFAYRYTSNILQDAVHFTNEGQATSGSGGSGGAGGGRGGTEGNGVGVAAIRFAVHSRNYYQYNPTLPKELYMNLMHDKNKVALPPVQRGPGVKLPPEQYMMTGQRWELGEEIELMESGGLGDDEPRSTDQIDGHDEGGDGVEGGRMEDIFGEGGGGGSQDDMEE